MNGRTYDVAIVGAGVCGAAIARELSRYRLDIVLLERCADVGFGVSKANSGIIHAGFHHKPGTLKARLEVRGNRLFDSLHRELGFPFKRVGILVVAFSVEEMKTLESLHRQGEDCGVRDIVICSAGRLREMEPVVNQDAVGALYAPSGGIIEPYRYVFALVESACRNGVELRTEFDVTRINKTGEVFEMYSRGGASVRARFVVNAAGLYADEISRMSGAEEFAIRPRKGEEYLLDRDAAAHPRHVLFPLPSRNSKGVLVIPTVEGTTMIGPTAEDVDDKEDVSTTRDNLEQVIANAKHMVPQVSRRDIITSFAGLRPALENGDFYIAESQKVPRFVQVAGIQSPGLTASPAIGEYVRDLLVQTGLATRPNESFDPALAPVETARSKTRDEMKGLIDADPRYARIVCRCETVSEAEIVEAIRRGHTTLDGIKFFTRAGMGRCQGGFCSYRILKILARETGRSIAELTKRGPGSWEIAGNLFDSSDNAGAAP